MALEILRCGGMQAFGRSADFTVWQSHEALEYITLLLGTDPRKRRRGLHAEAGLILQWHWLNLAGYSFEQIPPEKSEWLDVVKAYKEGKLRQNVVDKADLVPMAFRAMERDKGFRESFALKLYRHLLIDDFQDLVPAEYEMLRSLTGQERSVTVAVNPNESVGLSRAADDELLRAFRLDYPSARNHTYTLKLNLNMARIQGEALTRLAADPALTHLREEEVQFFNEGHMVAGAACPCSLRSYWSLRAGQSTCFKYILDGVEGFVEQGYALEDIACIYHDADFLDQLRVLAINRGLPYTVLGSVPRVWDRDVRCAVGLLGSLLNSRDLAALRSGACANPRLERQWLDPDIAMCITRIAADQHIALVEAAQQVSTNFLIDEDGRRDLGNL